MESFSYGIAHLISAVEGIDKQMKVWNRNLTEARENLKIQNQIVSEPFAEAERLKQKRSRYNEVMDILNPPKEEQKLDTDGGDAVQYQQRKPNSSPYKKISQQEYRQIQEDRMEKYGAKFDEMPRIDYTYEHDLLYVFENFDEDSFGVLERIDPAKYKAKADIYVEAFSDGEVQDYRDFSGRIARLRNFQKLRSVYRSNAGNGRAGTRNAGLDIRSEEPANRTGMPATSGDDQEQYQQRHKVLTNREVLEMAVDELEVSDLTPGERDALDIYKSS